MNFLPLWRHFALGDLLPDDTLAGELRKLAGRPLHERTAFLGFIAALAGQKSGELRVAALAALGGAHGYSALRIQVAALDDSDPATRRAALESLRDSVREHDEPPNGPRPFTLSAAWCHALYHPDPTIRAAALNPDRPYVGRRWHALVRWRDPAERPLIEARLECGVPDPADVEGVLGLVFAGLLPEPPARRRLQWAAAAAWIYLLPSDTAPPPRSNFVLEMTTEEAAAGSPTVRERLAVALARASRTAYPEARQALTRVLRELHRDSSSTWPFELVRLAALVDPQMLLDESIPLHLRRRAARAFAFEWPIGSDQRDPDSLIVEVLRSSVCRTSDDLPDLRVIGSVMTLFGTNIYTKLLTAWPADEIATAWARSPDDASFMLQWRSHSAADFRDFLDRVQPRGIPEIWAPREEDDDIRGNLPGQARFEPAWPEPDPPSAETMAVDDPLVVRCREWASQFPATTTMMKDDFFALLATGPAAPADLRRTVLDALRDLGESVLTAPYEIADEFTLTRRDQVALDANLVAGLPIDLRPTIAEGVLLAGWPTGGGENKLLDWLSACGIHEPETVEAYAAIVRDGRSGARRTARNCIQKSLTRGLRLARLARAFAWGIRLGRLLTGQLFRIEMLVGPQLGYTRLREHIIHVSAMPLLRGEPDGDAVVRGLILHEFGHHLYHAGEENLAIWDDAERQGLGRLINLVADEHLERNLRHRDPSYGDKLKVLNAYAFQRRAREIPIDDVIRCLGPAACDILPSLKLTPARMQNCVIIQNGRFLRELEAHDNSFARFMRSLRMGLGNRWGDPKVEAGLALFRGAFRKSTMSQLHDIADKLRQIFGDETRILDQFGQDSSLTWSENETCDADDFAPEELRSAVAADLGASSDGRSRPTGRTGQPRLNLNPQTEFRHIEQIVPLAPDPTQHASLAKQVRRHSAALRIALRDLGIGRRPERMRTAGRRLDRGRLRDMLLKGDPRVLWAREPHRFTDLFIGLVVDCSGSMFGPRIEKAKLFGALIAEAVRGLVEVDLRVFGFTDRTIYDAGNAHRCAVHALYAHDGNNDAAALWHASLIARRSHRKARLLVMISDGLPTECSVSSLRNLVAVLSRQGFCCAQVAVAPLSEICFPHYILLEDAAMDLTVKAFGNVVAKLVGAALKTAK